MVKGSKGSKGSRGYDVIQEEQGVRGRNENSYRESKKWLNGSTDIVKIIVSLMVIMGTLAGAILWATGAHDTIRDWTADQDYITKIECKEMMRDNYVRKYEFATVLQQIKVLEAQIEELKNRPSYLKDTRDIHALNPRKARVDGRQ